MEKYIQKIESRLDKKHHPEQAAKIKRRFLVVGGIVLAIGIVGILAAMICFAVFFVGGDTDTAFTCWIVAVPFVIVFIAGAVVSRVGDKLQKSAMARVQESKRKAFEMEEKAKKTEEENKTE